jgi:L-threonylcarbamoyladenylate synthase
VESTIIGLEDDQFVVFRPGGLALEDIEKALGSTLKTRLHSENPVAPGMLKNHYAPTKPFYLFEGTIETLDPKILADMQEKMARGKKMALLLARGKTERVPLALKNEAQVLIRVLSPQGSSQEAAKNLFRYLREIDQMNIDFIVAEQWPYTEVLGFALRDRMNRAAEKLEKSEKTTP